MNAVEVERAARRGKRKGDEVLIFVLLLLLLAVLSHHGRVQEQKQDKEKDCERRAALPEKTSRHTGTRRH